MIAQKLSLIEPISTERDYTNFCNCIEHLAIVSSVIVELGTVTDIDDKDSFNVLKKIIHCGVNAIDGIPISQDAFAAKLLDSGLPNVLFDTSNATEDEIGEKLATLPLYRVGISVRGDKDTTITTINTFSSVCSHFAIRFTEEDIANDLHASLLPDLLTILNNGQHRIEIYLSIPLTGFPLSDVFTFTTRNEHLHLLLEPRLRLHPDQATILPYFLQTFSAYQEGNIDLIDAFVASLRTDRVDGLYTTMVCDEYMKCLGLVYSNKESIRLAILEKKGVYYSRSRHTLWRKGDFSGMHQSLQQIKIDCDHDALLYIVKQHGQPASFCHTLTRSCWGDEKGLSKLQTVLQGRKAAAPAGSYTNRLFHDPGLLQQKLLEEVQELIEAKSPQHIAEEAADVMYFVLTRCVAAGVTIEDIEKQLDLRSLKITRRPGNAKEWRTQAAEQALNKKLIL